MPIQKRRCAEARLRFEALEDRSLLAIAAFEINLYRDVDGAPGELIADDTVYVGESFFAEITAQDYDPRDVGLAGVALDVSWNSRVLDETHRPFDPSKIITPELPFAQTGSRGDGWIRDLGGSAFVAAGRPIGGAGAERFALLHFEALQPATATPLILDQGASRIVTRPLSTLSSSQIEFENQVITILAADLPAAAPAGQVADDGALAVAATQVYQDRGQGIVPIAATDVDPNKAFFVEVTVESAGGDAQPSGSAGRAAASRTVTKQDSNDTAPALPGRLARLDLAALPSLADGEVLVTQVVVDVDGKTVDLPLAAGPLETARFAAGQTRTIGLSYLPHRPQTAAADAVLAATTSEELRSAAEAPIDSALLNALASGLAAAAEEEELNAFRRYPI